MLHQYLTPQTGTNTYLKHGDGKALDTYRPKYIGDLEGVAWSAEGYGIAPVFLVTADLSDFDDAEVSSQPDVFRFPDNQKEAIDFSAMKTFFVNNKIPADYLDPTWTHDDALAAIRKIFKMSQIIRGLQVTQKGEDLTTETKFSDFAPVMQDLFSLKPAASDSVLGMVTAVSSTFTKAEAVAIDPIKDPLPIVGK